MVRCLRAWHYLLSDVGSISVIGYRKKRFLSAMDEKAANIEFISSLSHYCDIGRVEHCLDS